MKFLFRLIILCYTSLKLMKSITYQLQKLNLTSSLSLRKLYIDSISGGSSGLNYYYAYLSIGNPPQKQSYIVDTGSQITTSPCSYCQKCGSHENKYFKPSNYNKPLKCNDNKCKEVSSSCDSSNQCSFSIVS